MPSQPLALGDHPAVDALHHAVGEARDLRVRDRRRHVGRAGSRAGGTRARAGCSMRLPSKRRATARDRLQRRAAHHRLRRTRSTRRRSGRPIGGRRRPSGARGPRRGPVASRSRSPPGGGGTARLGGASRAALGVPVGLDRSRIGRGSTEPRGIRGSASGARAGGVSATLRRDAQVDAPARPHGADEPGAAPSTIVGSPGRMRAGEPSPRPPALRARRRAGQQPRHEPAVRQTPEGGAAGPGPREATSRGQHGAPTPPRAAVPFARTCSNPVTLPRSSGG